MSILVDENTRVLVQGITGREGSFHARACIAYGTQVVAGVRRARAASFSTIRIPVFESVADAVEQTGANLSLIFVPPPSLPTPSPNRRTPGCLSSFVSPRESRRWTWCALYVTWKISRCA